MTDRDCTTLLAIISRLMNGSKRKVTQRVISRMQISSILFDHKLHCSHG